MTIALALAVTLQAPGVPVGIPGSGSAVTETVAAPSSPAVATTAATTTSSVSAPGGAATTAGSVSAPGATTTTTTGSVSAPGTTTTTGSVSAPGATVTTASEPGLTVGERAALRRAARRELLLDPGEVLQNQWPSAPYCNLDPKGKDVCMTLDSEVFTGFRHSALAGGRKLSEFALDRGELGTQLWWRPHWRVDTGVALRVEAVRSAGPQSLIGVDGNSLILRLAQAYGHAAVHLGPIDIGARFGQVPERWIEQLEKGYDTRGADPLASDRVVMFDRADLGATLTLSGWKGRFDVDASFTNGEGRAQLELNQGKNTTLIATVRPWRTRHARGPIALAVHGMYRDGSYGVPVAGAPGRNHRAGAALTFQSPWAFAGIEYVRAFGFNARPDLVSDVIGAWASAYAYQPWVGLMAKYDHVRQDVATAGTQVHVVSAALFSDVFGYSFRNRRRVRLYAGYQYEGYGPDAGPVPGAPEAANTHRFMLQLTAQGLFRVL